MKMCTISHYLLSAPVTFLLAALILLFSFRSFHDRSFFYKMALHPYDVVRNHRYYKLFTADFAHIDVQHFIVNEASLIFIGGNLERHLRHNSRFGSLQFTAIYLAGLLTGNIWMVIRHRNNIQFSTAGASGSIMGCLFGFMYLEPDKAALYLPVFGAVKNEYYALIYILLMVVLKKRIEKSGANYELHFWGALGGIFMTLAIMRF
jgi:membrane associated rhomboid family serine protease